MMEIIKSLKQLNEIRAEDRFDNRYLNYIGRHLQRIWKAYNTGERIVDYPNQEIAQLVLLEDNSDLKAEMMRKVGVNDNLLKTGIEYVDKLENDQMVIYVIGITKNNETMIECFLKPEHFSIDIQEWLEENSISPDYYKIDDMSPEDPPF